MRLYEILLLIAQRAKKPFPVGAIYMSVDPTNPSEIFGGTWESWGGVEFQ